MADSMVSTAPDLPPLLTPQDAIRRRRLCAHLQLVTLALIKVPMAAPAPARGIYLPAGLTLAQVVDRYTREVLFHSGGCKKVAAATLGVCRRTIYNLLRPGRRRIALPALLPALLAIFGLVGLAAVHPSDLLIDGLSKKGAARDGAGQVGVDPLHDAALDVDGHAHLGILRLGAAGLGHGLSLLRSLEAACAPAPELPEQRADRRLSCVAHGHTSLVGSLARNLGCARIGVYGPTCASGLGAASWLSDQLRGSFFAAHMGALRDLAVGPTRHTRAWQGDPTDKPPIPRFSAAQKSPPGPVLAIFGLVALLPLSSCHPRPPREVPLQDLAEGAALAELGQDFRVEQVQFLAEGERGRGGLPFRIGEAGADPGPDDGRQEIGGALRSAGAGRVGQNQGPVEAERGGLLEQSEGGRHPPIVAPFGNTEYSVLGQSGPGAQSGNLVAEGQIDKVTHGHRSRQVLVHPGDDGQFEANSGDLAGRVARRPTCLLGGGLCIVAALRLGGWHGGDFTTVAPSSAARPRDILFSRPGPGSRRCARRPRRRPIDHRILAAVQEPRTLHDLTLALWPDLDQGPWETALSAIAYLRHRVAALVAQGRLVLQGGMLLSRRCARLLEEAVIADEVGHA